MTATLWPKTNKSGKKSFTNSQSVTDIIEVITQKRNQTTPQCGQLQSQLEVAFKFQIQIILYPQTRVSSLKNSSVWLKKSSVELIAAVTRVLKAYSTERRQFISWWTSRLFYNLSESYRVRNQIQ